MNSSANLKDENLYEWIATIQGPPNSVYEGGVFVLDIHLSPEYPYTPPKVEIVISFLYKNHFLMQMFVKFG